MHPAPYLLLAVIFIAGCSDFFSPPVHVDALTVCETETDNNNVLTDCLSARWDNVSAWQADLDGSNSISYSQGNTNELVRWNFITDERSPKNKVLAIEYANVPANGGLLLGATYPLLRHDMRAYSHGTLHFDVKLISRGNNNAFLTAKVDCGYPCESRATRLDIQELNRWYAIALPIEDLVQKGLDLAKVDVPLLVTPQWHNMQGVHYQLANIRWEKSPPAEQNQPQPSTDWAAIAKDVLDFIYSTATAHHPGAIDAQNPAFSQWLSLGHQQAIARANRATTKAEAKSAISFYLAGFNDVHFYSNFSGQNHALQWAGVVLQRQGTAYNVIHTAERWPSPLPPLNSVLLGCDGREADTILDEDILPFRQNDRKLQALRNRWANRLLIDDGLGARTAFNQCVFFYNGRSHYVDMQWLVTTDDAIAPHFYKKSGLAPLSIREVKPKQFWVTLNTFSLTAQGVVAMEAVQTAIEQLDAPELVVLDLRNNTGGNSLWGNNIASALLGEAAVMKYWLLESSPEFAQWRATDSNLRDLEHNRLVHLAATVGEFSESYQFTQKIVDAMREDLAAGNATTQQVPTPTRWQSFSLDVVKWWVKDSKPKIQSPIVVLTSHRCVSACLDFMAVMGHFPNVIHMGQETLVDTAYTDVRSLELPHAMGVLTLPMKVRRGKTFAPNKPRLAYNGDIFADEAVQAWVLETALAQSIAQSERN